MNPNAPIFYNNNNNLFNQNKFVYNYQNNNFNRPIQPQQQHQQQQYDNHQYNQYEQNFVDLTKFLAADYVLEKFVYFNNNNNNKKGLKIVNFNFKKKEIIL